MSDLRGQPGTSPYQLPQIRLLFDENLSPRLVGALANLYPGAAHVRDLALASADDEDVWDVAKNSGHTIVSKDSDFHHLSFVRGAPPRVIWLDVGNCSTKQIEDILRASTVRIIAFHRDAGASFLILP